MQKQVGSLPRNLSPRERLAIIQLLWVGDVLDSFRAYFAEHSWEWCILNSLCNAVSADNPKIKELFT